MKKVLIFGDSHVASLYSAYKHQATDLGLRFFPSSGPVANYIKFIGKYMKLLPSPEAWPNHERISQEMFQQWYDTQKSRFTTETGGSVEIDLTVFDSVIVYGGNLLPINNFKWWLLVEQYKRYSKRLCQEMLEEAVKNQVGYKWLSGLSDYIDGGGKVYFALNPYLNEVGLEGDHNSDQNLTTLQLVPKNAIIQDVFHIYRDFFEHKGVEFIYPPAELFSTRAAASQYKSKNPRDFSHLNSEGALLMLNKILTVIN